MHWLTRPPDRRFLLAAVGGMATEVALALAFDPPVSGFTAGLMIGCGWCVCMAIGEGA